MKEDTPLSAYPKTSESSPLILIRSNDVSQCTMPEERHFWYYTILLGEAIFIFVFEENVEVLSVAAAASSSSLAFDIF